MEDHVADIERRLAEFCDRSPALRNAVSAVAQSLYEMATRGRFVTRIGECDGPLPELMVGEGLDAEQIWEELNLLWKPTSSKLEKKLGKLASSSDALQLIRPEVQMRAGRASEHPADSSQRRNRRNGIRDEDEDNTNAEDTHSGASSSEELTDAGSSDDDDDDAPVGLRRHVSSSGDKDRANGGDDHFFSTADLQRFLEQQDAIPDDELGLNGSDDESDSDADAEISGAPSPMDRRRGTGTNAADMKYSDFFDPVRSRPRRRTDGAAEFGSDSDEDDDEVFGSPSSSAAEEGVEDADNVSSGASQDEEDEVEALFGKDHKILKLFDESEKDELRKMSQQDRSAFQQQLAKVQAKIAELEEENVGAKSWALSGEVSSKHRPKNSLLEADVTFDHAAVARHRPPTEATNTNVESVIKQRILQQMFDDVERQVLEDDAVDVRPKGKEVGLEKSKKSLAQLYEEDYLEAVYGKEETRNPLHEEVALLFRKLCFKLDAMTSLTYTPKPYLAEAERASQSRSGSGAAAVATVALEDAIPDAMNKESGSFPEQVYRQKRQLTHQQKKRLLSKRKKAQAPSTLLEALQQRQQKDKKKRMANGQKQQQRSGPGDSAVKFGNSASVFRKLQRDITDSIASKLGEKRPADPDSASGAAASYAPNVKRVTAASLRL